MKANKILDVTGLDCPLPLLKTKLELSFMIYDKGAIVQELLKSSLDNEEHVKKAAIYGADIATLPPQVVSELAIHPLTDKGLKAFLDDWESSGQKIL